MNERPTLVNDLILAAICGLRKHDLPEDDAQEIRAALWKAWHIAYPIEETARLEKAVDTTPAL